MSLIDDALKRAETDKRRRPAGGPGGGAGGGGARARPRGNLRGALLLMVFAAAGVAGTLRVSWMFHTPVPRPVAAQAPLKSAAARPEPVPAAPPAAPEAGDAALERTLAELANYRPSPRPAQEAADAPRPAATPPAHESIPPRVVRRIAPPAPAPSPAEDPGPALTPDNFTLGGIMRSGDMANAVVNGQAVGVGDIVDGARVVEITSRQVVLEKAGRRLALRM